MPASDNAPQPIPEVIPDAIMSVAARRTPRHPRARVKLTNGLWQDVEVIAWAKCQAGWAARVRWPNGQEDWSLYTPTAVRPSLIRPVVHHATSTKRAGRTPAYEEPQRYRPKPRKGSAGCARNAGCCAGGCPQPLGQHRAVQ